MNSGQPLPYNLAGAKYQALGNSYIVLDPRNFIEDDCARIALDESGFPRREFIAILCDADRSIGSNGVLFGPLAPSGDPHVFSLTIINSDGTLAGFSGNGIRIFTQHLADNGDVQIGSSIRFDIDDDSQRTGSKFVPFEY